MSIPCPPAAFLHYSTRAGRADPVGPGHGARAFPAVATDATSDPREWPASSWIADLVRHLAYGFVTAVSAEAVLGESRRWPLERVLEPVRS
jgi:hypothetical protein